MNYSLKRILAGIDRGEIVTVPEVGTGYFTASREIVRSGAALETHTLYAVHSGSVVATVGKRRCGNNAGSFVWISAGFTHDLSITKGSRISALSCKLTKNGIPVHLEIPFVWFPDGGRPFELLSLAARDRWTADDHDSRVRLKSYLMLLLSYFEHMILQWTRKDAGSSFTTGQQMAVAGLVMRRIRERISVDDIAAMLKMTPGRCTRLFKSTYGIPPRRYILEERMKAAARDIRDTDMPVYAVAGAYGYESVHTFSRLFKEVLGISPARIRR